MILYPKYGDMSFTLNTLALLDRDRGQHHVRRNQTLPMPPHLHRRTPLRQRMPPPRRILLLPPHNPPPRRKPAPPSQQPGPVRPAPPRGPLCPSPRTALPSSPPSERSCV